MLDEMARSCGPETGIRIEHEPGSGIIRIFGYDATSLGIARKGVGDLLEHSHHTAEHHPFWALLYHCAEISETILSKWEDQLTADEMDEIDWSIRELKDACARIRADADS